MSTELGEQYDKIYRYCWFRLGDASLAEDLTQETFLRFFTQHSYIGRGKPLAYLYTIAKNLCIDAYRKPDTAPLDETLLDTPFDALDDQIAVGQALHALPHEMREVILLRYVSELSVMEVGAILGISRFAVHRRITSALKLLKMNFREEDFAL